jgi:hypothetical protein
VGVFDVNGEGELQEGDKILVREFIRVLIVFFSA